IAHLDRWRQAFMALVEQLTEVFAGVLAAGEEQRDRGALLTDRHDGRREQARTLRVLQLPLVEQSLSAFAHELQNWHMAVVVVDDRAPGGQSYELVAHGPASLNALLDDIPLGRCRDGGVEIALKLVQTVERHSRAITQQ